MPVIRLKLPKFIQTQVKRHYLDISPSRVLPLAILIVAGVLAGLVFNTGVGHPYDKVIHIGFFGLLTLSIHRLFCCRLRLSAISAFSIGLIGELIQGYLPSHESSLSDAFANGLGVAIVVTLIALKRSEEKQALRGHREQLDLEQMGLQPVYSDYSSEWPPESGRSSEK